jgi:hypothetical protein
LGGHKNKLHDGERIKPLMFGVCLAVSELEKLLPDMMALKSYEVGNDRRKVWFVPQESIAQRKILLHDLRVCKANGVESRIYLSNDDIKKID